MMKGVFYFILKVLFVLKVFKFLSTKTFCTKNGLIRNIKLVSKFMTPQLGQQTVAMHILANISQARGKGNIFLQNEN